MSDTFGVILGDAQSFKVPDVAKALAEFHQIPLPDAARMAKSLWGIVGENLSKEKATELQNSLQKVCLPSVLVPTDLFIPVPKPRLISELSFQDAGLHVKFQSGVEGNIPWSTFVVLSALPLTETIVKTQKIEKQEGSGGKMVRMGILLATGIPLPGKKKEVVEKKTESKDLLFYLDIYTLRPLGRLRIDAQHLKYTFLKERMQYNVLNNFRILLQDLAGRAPQAILNMGSRIIKDSRPLNQLSYESEADLENESRWLLTLLSK